MARKRTQNEAKASSAKRKKSSKEEILSTLEKLFGIHFPQSIPQFYNFCKKVNSADPLEALSAINLKLVGPFEYIEKELLNEELNLGPLHYHMTWRHFYDPPECLTLLVDKSQSKFHLSLITDDPKESSHSVIVSNDGESCKLKLVGDDLFTAVCSIIKSQLRTSDNAADKLKLTELDKSLKDFCTKHNISTASYTKTSARTKQAVSKTLHGAGMIVKEKGGCGYRQVFTSQEISRNMKAIVKASDDDERIKRFSPLLEIQTHLQFADDETDFGARLEFGLDLFCNGSMYFHKMATSSLTLAYTLLDRPLYGEIIEKHLADRRHDNLPRTT